MPRLPEDTDPRRPGGLQRRCRAARSRQRKAETQRERDAEIRTLLAAALKKLQDGVP